MSRGDLNEAEWRLLKDLLPPERGSIERMIAHPRVHRAVAIRTDKLARSFHDVLHLAAIRRCLRFATS
ncbi:MAG: hypothetical protein FJX47_17765 [Alphaproteobacteria bacterium]|nr:hypothetical protein [Alphaproteobacteria bacterium]